MYSVLDIRRVGEILCCWFFGVVRKRRDYIVEGEIRKREEVNK